MAFISRQSLFISYEAVDMSPSSMDSDGPAHVMTMGVPVLYCTSNQVLSMHYVHLKVVV